MAQLREGDLSLGALQALSSLNSLRLNLFEVFYAGKNSPRHLVGQRYVFSRRPLHYFPVTLQATNREEQIVTPPQTPVEIGIASDDRIQPAHHVPRLLLTHEDVERVVVVESRDQ